MQGGVQVLAAGPARRHRGHVLIYVSTWPRVTRSVLRRLRVCIVVLRIGPRFAQENVRKGLRTLPATLWRTRTGPAYFSRIFCVIFSRRNSFFRALFSDTSWLQCVTVRLQAAVWMSFCPTAARATGASTTATRARMWVLFLALCAAFLAGSTVISFAAPTWGSGPLARSMAARYVHKAQPSRDMSTYA